MNSQRFAGLACAESDTLRASMLDRAFRGEL